jgi:glucose-1-phosphate adenylyltransferase
MFVNNEVLAIILGGGQGTRLFPLTQLRSKPAVPIAGQYRLIDIPISNCLHADIRRIFVLTQFNSASLNRHINQTYRMDLFRAGLRRNPGRRADARQSELVQGTADAVRQAARHFARHDADYYLILAGDHLYRMDYNEMVDAHIDRRADITIAAQPVTAEDAPAMGIFRFDRSGRIVAFEEKPKPDRLKEIGQSIPQGATLSGHTPAKPFVASMGVYVFSRDVLLDVLTSGADKDFGREVIPAALDRYGVSAYLFRGFWADVGTVASFYDANIMLTRPDTPFKFYDANRPIYTHPRFLPGSRLGDCSVRQAIIVDGCVLDRLRDRAVESSASALTSAAAPRFAARCCSAPTTSRTRPACRATATRTSASAPTPCWNRVIVDKNARIGEGARLVNEKGIDHADGDGYFIRNGIIVVPKDGMIRPGTVV